MSKATFIPAVEAVVQAMIHRKGTADRANRSAVRGSLMKLFGDDPAPVDRAIRSAVELGMLREDGADLIVLKGQ